MGDYHTQALLQVKPEDYDDNYDRAFGKGKYKKKKKKEIREFKSSINK